MKKELILLAALALPIQAQQPESPSKILTSMGAVSAKATAATPAERAKAFPALAKLPKDTGDFIVMTKSTAPILETALTEPGATAPTTFAVASSEKNAPIYVAAAKLAVMEALCDTMNLAITGLASGEGASPAAKEQMKKLAASLDKEAAEVAKALAGKKLHPIYVITSFEAAPVSGSDPVDGMTLDTLLQDIKKVIETGSKTHPGLDALMAEAAKHQLSVKETKEGTTRITCICEKGLEPKFATKPEDSVLASPKMARTDAGIKGNMLAAGYASPELQTALGKTYLFYSTLSQQMTATGMALHEETSGMAAAQLKAMEATHRWLKAFIGPDAKKPGSFQVWTDKKQSTYHVTIDMDARGCSYAEGLTQTKAADAKNTFLYIESTGLKRPQPLPDISTIVAPMVEIATESANAYSAARAEMAGEGDIDDEPMDVAGPEWGGLLPAVLPIVEDLVTIGKGMGDGFAVIGDFAAKGKDKKTPFPRLAYSCKIADMAQLTKGWEQLSGHAGALMGELKTTSKAGKDGATCHRLKLPVNEGDFVPNALEDGKNLILGTSIKLNKSMMKECSSAKSVAFKGAVFMLNIDKLTKGLKAASSDPESIIPPVGDALLPGGGVKSVFGSSTISNGVHTIQLDINLK